VEKTIDQICADALREIETAKSKDSLNAVSLKYLSRKGIVTQFLRSISKLPPEERPKAGERANETNILLEKAVEDAITSHDTRAPDTDGFIDVSLPGRSALPGLVLILPKYPKLRETIISLRLSTYPNTIRQGICRILSMFRTILSSGLTHRLSRCGSWKNANRP